MAKRNKGTVQRISAALSIAGILTGTSATALAADPYQGQIGRIDTRTGHADTATYRNSIVIRDTSSSIICAVDATTQLAEAFLSQATAAMLAGRTVTIERGGALNGQFKCYQIQVRR
jgi:hypothetical protein